MSFKRRKRVVQRFASPEVAGARAAGRILLFLRERKRGPVVLGLPGGRSVGVVLSGLREMAGEGELSRLHFFQTDEFLPTELRPKSNWDVLGDCFFDEALRTGIIREGQLHPMRLSEDFRSDIARYGRELDRFGGKFDVVVLAAGGGRFPDGTEDTGHIAGIPPGREWIWQSEERFVIIRDMPKPPKTRVSGTPYLFRKADMMIGLVLREEKRNALEAYVGGRMSSVESPIRIVAEVEDRGVLFTDMSP